MFSKTNKKLEDLTNLSNLLAETLNQTMVDFDDVRGGFTLSELGCELGLLNRYEDELYYVDQDKWEVLYTDLRNQLQV